NSSLTKSHENFIAAASLGSEQEGFPGLSASPWRAAGKGLFDQTDYTKVTP
ncbi:hypothetical protein BaRGS_00007756, partial [Batillaria attramentaria]